MVYQDLELDEQNHVVEVAGQELALTAKEYGILELLMKHPEKIYSKANLFRSIWNEEYMSEDNTLNVHISNIRNKLKAASPEKQYIETVWGIGYRLYKLT
ncbi:Alkaline phosphatase synthesis transcriptional regulatory protein SphR [compost metagenome]